VNRAAVCDLEQALPRFGSEVSREFDLSLDAIDPTRARVALLTVPDVNLLVAEPDADSFEGDALAVRVHPERHRRVRPERGQQQVVGSRAAVVASDRRRLITAQVVMPGANILGKVAGFGLAYPDLAFGSAGAGGAAAKNRLAQAAITAAAYSASSRRRRRWSAWSSDTKLLG